MLNMFKDYRGLLKFIIMFVAITTITSLYCIKFFSVLRSVGPETTGFVVGVPWGLAFLFVLSRWGSSLQHSGRKKRVSVKRYI